MVPATGTGTTGPGTTIATCELVTAAVAGGAPLGLRAELTAQAATAPRSTSTPAVISTGTTRRFRPPWDRGSEAGRAAGAGGAGGEVDGAGAGPTVLGGSAGSREAQDCRGSSIVVAADGSAATLGAQPALAAERTWACRRWSDSMPISNQLDPNMVKATSSRSLAAAAASWGRSPGCRARPVAMYRRSAGALIAGHAPAADRSTEAAAHDLHRAHRVEQQVRRAQCAVQHTAAVYLGQAARGRGRDVERGGRLERAALAQHLPQGDALDQLRHQRRSTVDVDQLVDVGNVDMFEDVQPRPPSRSTVTYSSTSRSTTTLLAPTHPVRRPVPPHRRTHVRVAPELPVVAEGA